MATGIALGPSGVAPADAQMILNAGGSAYSWGFKTELFEKSTSSGSPLSFVNENMRFRIASTQTISMSTDDKLRQYRYTSIERSFMKHSDGLPGNKMSYMEYMANVMCGLSFSDNISSYNKFDDTIDSVFRLDGDLTLTMSQFLDEKIDAPVVFSIHRGEDLLVSAEMRMEELEKTVNEVIESELTENV